jgi:hypothetical protein
MMSPDKRKSFAVGRERDKTLVGEKRDGLMPLGNVNIGKWGPSLN